MLQIDRDKKPGRPIRPMRQPEETAAHDAFLAKLKDPIWPRSNWLVVLQPPRLAFQIMLINSDKIDRLNI